MSRPTLGGYSESLESDWSKDHSDLKTVENRLVIEVRKANALGADFNIYRLPGEFLICEDVREECWGRTMVLSSHLVEDAEGPRLG